MYMGVGHHKEAMLAHSPRIRNGITQGPSARPVSSLRRRPAKTNLNCGLYLSVLGQPYPMGWPPNQSDFVKSHGCAHNLLITMSDHPRPPNILEYVVFFMSLPACARIDLAIFLVRQEALGKPRIRQMPSVFLQLQGGHVITGLISEMGSIRGTQPCG